MSDTTNTTRIGAFVLGALILTITGIIIFGSGALFRQTMDYVLYFDGSVQGLSEGSPVVFRGVKVGRVKDLLLEADLRDFSFKVPVIIEIEPDRVVLKNKDNLKGDPMDEMVRKGLRGQLLPQSLVTGQYLIHLDILPDTPINMANVDVGYPEIPTVPSPLERFSKTMEKLPLSELVNEFHGAVSGIRRLVEAPETDEALKALRNILTKADRRIGPLAAETSATLNELRTAAGGVNQNRPPLLTDARKAMARVEQLAENFDATLAEAREALGQGRRTLTTAQTTLDEDSPVMVQLRETLKELDSMGRSVRQLSDYIKRHPDALLRGRSAPRDERE